MHPRDRELQSHYVQGFLSGSVFGMLVVGAAYLIGHYIWTY